MNDIGPAHPAQTPVAQRTDGFVSGAPGVILRLEGAAVLAAAALAYAQVGQGWKVFAILFLVPDLSMLGYLFGPRVGAAAYNTAHSYILPAALGASGALLHQPYAIAGALIWIAHVGFDRLLGYGLKYSTAFGHTHLGLAHLGLATGRRARAKSA